MKLPLIPEDKANHFVYGFVIYVLANLFLNDYYSFGIVIAFGIGREVYQKVNKTGHVELMDVIYTLIPALILFLKAILI